FICNNEKVGHLGSYTSHERSFLAVALSSGPEDSEHLASSQGSQGSQYFLQAIRCVSIINDDGEGLPLVDMLHAARYSCSTCQAAYDIIDGYSLAVGGCRCSQTITDIEAANKPGFNVTLGIWKDQAKTGATCL